MQNGMGGASSAMMMGGGSAMTADMMGAGPGAAGMEGTPCQTSAYLLELGYVFEDFTGIDLKSF